MDEKIEIRPGRTVDILTSPNPNTETTLFFIHGLGGRKEHWQAQYEALKSDYAIVAFDLLGHGQSNKPVSDKSNIYRFDELERDVQIVFDRFASAHNVVLGHSYGGALATALALANPSQIDKLILLSPTPLAPNTKIPFLFTLPAWAMELIRFILERQMANMIFAPNADPELIKRETLINRNNPMHVIRCMVQGFLTMPQCLASKLQQPSLLMLGKHDKLITPAVSANFYQHAPNMKTVTFENAGHIANLEVPNEVTSAIRAFVESS